MIGTSKQNVFVGGEKGKMRKGGESWKTKKTREWIFQMKRVVETKISIGNRWSCSSRLITKARNASWDGELILLTVFQRAKERG